MDRPLITGTFRDRAAADRAYSDFRDRGYTDDDLHVMMSDETRESYGADPNATIDDSDGSKALEGAGAGGAVGGTLGGILGAIVGVGSNVLLPGIGLVAGPLAGALAGAGAGGAAGSLVGALVGAGIPEDHAKRYEADVRDGGVVMGVHPRDDDYDYVSGRYGEYGADNVYDSRTAMGTPTSGTGLGGGTSAY